MTEIYLIRHGEAEGNVFRRLHGQYDALLTPRGHRQLPYVRDRFANIHIDACYASDLTRTSLTAQSIYLAKDLTLHRDPRLREVHCGEWEDRTYGWLHHYEHEQMHLFSHDPVKWRAPGAETFEVPDGAQKALDELDGAVYGDFGNVHIDEVIAAKDAGGNDLGTVVSVTNKDGRDAPISLSVGIQPDGTISGIVYTDLNETPGIGMKVADASFTDQFVGVKAEKLAIGGEIDAATGATISSEAVVNAVNAALDFWAVHVQSS